MVPLALLGPCLAVIQVIGQISTLLGIVSVNLLPPDNDPAALKSNEMWRLIQGI